MAQLVRCYFRETGAAISDQSFPAGTAFELALDCEASLAELAAGTQFRVVVGVRNFNVGGAAIIPAPVAATGTPASNVPANMATAAWPAATPNRTFVYTIPAGTGVAGQFLEADGALITGAVNPVTDIGSAECVII